MAYEESLKTITLPAAGDLSGSQYRVVKVNTSGQIELCTAGAKAVGVLQDKPPAAGMAACVGICGVTKVYAVSGVAAGDQLEATTNGAADTHSAGEPFGIALEDAPDSGGIITAVLI